MIDYPRHVYVHVPFCARRCSYCDFAIAVRKPVPVSEYYLALKAELTTRFAGETARPRIETLYLGGGTPSHLGADGVAAVVELMEDFFTFTDRIEITVEANPEDVNLDTLYTWKLARVSRVSLGAQTFDPAVLEWMHRTHTVADIRQAVQDIKEANFDSWSFDLIFSLPPSLKRDWQRDLDAALELEPPHLSLYGLTIEPGTPLGRWAERGEVIAAPDEEYEQQFLQAHAAATAAGLEHYEVSNFARKGHRSRHNQVYWSGKPYLAFGPGAHGFDGEVRRWNAGAYALWRDRAMSGSDPIHGSERIDVEARTLEQAYLGLRTTKGLRVDDAGKAVARQWVDAGWATMRGNLVKLTPTGWLRLDALATSITPAPAST